MDKHGTTIFVQLYILNKIFGKITQFEKYLCGII